MKSLLTGIVYILILLGAFLLRRYVHLLFFDALVLLFSVLGTWEMLRAFGDRIDRAQKTLVLLFSSGIIICYAAADTIYRHLQEMRPATVNYSPLITFVVFMAGLALLFGLLVFRHEKTSLESLGCSLICYLYPSVFLLVLTGCNHMPDYSEIGILFVFVICPFADSLAYVFGRLFGRWLPKKLAPTVSPNKTLIGGFGGLVGGALGAVCIFFVYYGLLEPCDLNTEWLNLVFFIALGVLTAAFTEFGDLVESAVKRKLEIKDMGRLLPGHGGILDRIDSTLYAGLIVCFVLTMRILAVG